MRIDETTDRMCRENCGPKDEHIIVFIPGGVCTSGVIKTRIVAVSKGIRGIVLHDSRNVVVRIIFVFTFLERGVISSIWESWSIV